MASKSAFSEPKPSNVMEEGAEREACAAPDPELIRRRGPTSTGARTVELPAATAVLEASVLAYVAAAAGNVGWQNFCKMLLVFGCIGSDFCK